MMTECEKMEVRLFARRRVLFAKMWVSNTRNSNAPSVEWGKLNVILGKTNKAQCLTWPFKLWLSLSVWWIYSNRPNCIDTEWTSRIRENFWTIVYSSQTHTLIPIGSQCICSNEQKGAVLFALYWILTSRRNEKKKLTNKKNRANESPPTKEILFALFSSAFIYRQTHKDQNICNNLNAVIARK